MDFAHVDPARIERDWPAYAEILWPAVRQDPGATLEGLRQRLAAGADHLLTISGDASGLMVIEVTDGLCCWIKYTGGKIYGGPHRRAAAVRAAMKNLEAVAKAAGCNEIRLCGRDWSAVLPDYAPDTDHPNGLKKELT